ncbi:glycerophosphodiester phosphodiesterase family protein [Butyrivibrio sp. INlla16]|uniref:glycerophosphodiester phosphodiesterase family protein n=1 Tax=Butyrivibrio sp. INlla16 TaxID=1520807 RepID=UPI00087F4448|nr:glycerophosphodiester phosphodiesterase family protein [Butyrivibrio sp. INlla16]SDB47797.1 Glycerophosphoryl diester phosphodiesterase family protein [Butyrivibrio sp. INlla16]
MKKTVKAAIFIIIIALMLIFGISFFTGGMPTIFSALTKPFSGPGKEVSSEENRAEIARVRDELLAEGHIVHAAGFIQKGDGEQVNYTSSLEALKNCYEKGNNFCELDFLMTTDGQLVCAHSWKQLYDNGEALSGAVSLEQALNCKVEGEFTPLDLDRLSAFMRDHTNIYIVTDIKQDYNIDGARFIAEKYPELMDRMIIQVYHEQEAVTMEKIGFRYIIYTLYRTSEEERTPEAIRNDASKHDFVAWTVKKSFLNDELISAIDESGGVIFTHTINDPEDMKNYIAMGVDGFYSDVVSWDDIKKELGNGR